MKIVKMKGGKDYGTRTQIVGKFGMFVTSSTVHDPGSTFFFKCAGAKTLNEIVALHALYQAVLLPPSRRLCFCFG